MAELDDEEMPDFDLSEINGDSSGISIEDIIAEDRADEEAEDSFLKKNKDRSVSRAAVLGLLALLLVGVSLGGIVVFDPFGDDKDNNNTGEQIEVPKNTDPELEIVIPDDPDIVNEDNFYQRDDKYFPIETEEWQKTPYDTLDTNTEPASDNEDDSVNNSGNIDEEFKATIIEYSAGSDIDRASGTLPSEMTGFTADIGKVENPDGSLNPMFSYWTKEVFETELTLIVERLLNPVFGGWEMYQWSEYEANKFFDLSLFSDIFTERYVSENIDEPYSEWIPVYADWGANDYGMKDKILPSGSRWFGEVTSSNIEFVYDDETSQYNVTYVADVKFTAWGQDQSKMEKNGTLVLNLVSNVDQLNGSNNRVLIDGASLTVK